MLQNYLKIAWRNLVRNKVYSAINIGGLAISLTTGLLISLYVLDELAYDQFHQKANRIVMLQQFENTPASGGKLATDFRQTFAQVENTVRLRQANPLIISQQATFYEDHFFFADSSAFSVFTLPLLLGNPRTALTEQYGVVLSESTARKYFSAKNPLGQTLQYDKKYTLHVTGVMRDLPGNSHQKIDFLANYANANELLGQDVTTNLWAGSAWTYLLLAPGAKPQTIEAQFPAYLKQLKDPNVAIWKLKLIPLSDIYLKTDLVASNRLAYVTVFSLVAFLILALATFNYVNLSTARAIGRAKEVGVRKVLGSTFSQLRGQFLGETMLFVLLALGLTVLLVPIALPVFNSLADKELRAEALLTPARFLGLLAGVVLLGLVAGAYPAFVLSSAKPALILKGSISSNKGGKASLLRQTLVVGQFAVSISMLVATLVVYHQLNYIHSANLGYQREQVLVTSLHDATIAQKQQFKEQVKQLSGVQLVSQSYSVPGSGALLGEKLVSDYAPKGVQDLSISRQTIDENFLKTFNIKLLQGRNLDADRPADRTAFLVNEAAMKYFGWTNLTNKMVGYYTFEYDQAGNYREVPQRGPVVGVVADYHQQNLKKAIQPLLFSLTYGWEGQLSIKIQAGTVPKTIRKIDRLWKQTFPATPFEYEFMDDFFDRSYRAEQRTGELLGLFAGLSILISCLGLFGLATLAAQQRTKEIGVRKVLGASVGSIVALLSKDFLKLVLIAIVIASPIAWYAMNRWLQGFAYKIDIEWWVFAISGLLAVGIALLTVSFQSMKAALMNPVKSLRSD